VQRERGQPPPPPRWGRAPGSNFYALGITRCVYLNPTPPPGPRSASGVADGGYPLARQSRMKSTTPCRCSLPIWVAHMQGQRVDLVNAPTKRQVVKNLPAPCA
jgi:hypothetical protein